MGKIVRFMLKYLLLTMTECFSSFNCRMQRLMQEVRSPACSHWVLQGSGPLVILTTLLAIKSCFTRVWSLCLQELCDSGPSSTYLHLINCPCALSWTLLAVPRSAGKSWESEVWVQAPATSRANGHRLGGQQASISLPPPGLSQWFTFRHPDRS